MCKLYIHERIQHIQLTLIKRFPLIKPAHERLVVVRGTLDSSYMSAGWRTGLRTDRRNTISYIYVPTLR